MRAVFIDAYGETPKLGEVPDPPPPAAGQVAIKVAAAALNRADLKIVAGGVVGRALHAAQFPLVIGYDLCGAITALGDGVEGLAVDDMVFGHLPYAPSNHQGSLAEAVVVPAASVGRAPEGLDPTFAAASATTGLTALQALRDLGRLGEGQRVLVNGASGGVGSFAVQIARVLGATSAGTCSAAKAEFVRELGCDRVIDYRQTPLGDIEGPFDVVFDAAAASSYGACKGLLGPKGVYVTTLPSPAAIWAKLATLFSGRTAAIVGVQSRRADLEALAEWMAHGAVRVPLDATVDLDAVPEALARLASGEVRGKVAVRVG